MKTTTILTLLVSIILISCSGTSKKANEDVIARTERTRQSQEQEKIERDYRATLVMTGELESEDTSFDSLESLKWATLYKDVEMLGDTVFGGDGRWSFFSSYYGTYVWEEKCNDCERIEKRLTLKDNFTFELRIEYLGSDKPSIETYEGSFNYNGDSESIILYQKDGIKLDDSTFILKDNVVISIKDNSINIRKSFSNQLTSDKWYLQSAKDFQFDVGNELEKSNLYIKFEKWGGVKGMASCNSFSGSFDVDEDGFVTVSGLIMTYKSCEKPEVRKKYGDFLSQKFRYIIRQDTLEFMDSDNNALAKFVR